MKYLFPIITDIQDVYTAIEGREEFIVKDTDWGYIFNYLVNYVDTFPQINTRDPILNRNYAIRRECRGLKFNNDGQIIARPFHKFFNMGERPETQFQNLPLEDYTILHKMDGSMIHPILVDDEIIWCTKMGHTDTAKLAVNYMDGKPEYEEAGRHAISLNATPLWEFTSRRQRIVVDYPKEAMTLLALRDNKTGNYLHNVEEFGKAFNIPTVPVAGTSNMSAEDLTAFIADAAEKEGEEGYVIKIGPLGHAVKVKNLWYCQLHKSKELMKFEKDIWKIVLTNNLDDVKVFMADDEVEALDRFADDLNRNIREFAEKLKWEVIEAEDNARHSKKKFALAMKDHPYRNLAFNIFDGAEPDALVRAYALRHFGIPSKDFNFTPLKATAATLEQARPMANGIKWFDYNMNPEVEE